MNPADGLPLVDRSFSGRAWCLRPADEARGLALAQRLGLPAIVARILSLRGIEDDEVEPFLRPRLKHWLVDPSHLLDLDEAVGRLADAAAAGETIGLIGDYDVDGATSTALVRRYFEDLGVPVAVEIPDRLTDGYGPNPDAIDRLAALGCRLIVTLDSGTTAHAALDHAAARGVEVIVVDHHSAETALPRARAVVNPNRRDQTSPLTHLAAVGVAFVLLVGLNRELRRRGTLGHEPDLMAWLDLVALGTVCDVVPLLGLNRAFVTQGLKVAGRGANLGLQALAAVAGLERLESAGQFGFALGPRINAGGRMGRSRLGVDLLTAADEAAANEVARQLHALNVERQTIERECLAAARRQAERQAGLGRPVIVAHDRGWHPGVLGIVAGRLVEAFDRPAVVVGQGGKGSGRSVPGFDLGAAVIAARQAGILRHGGGHPMAAGLTVDGAQIDAFAEAVSAAFAQSPAVAGALPLVLDGELAPASATVDLCQKLARLAPFGVGNLEPMFALGNARVIRAKPVGNGHVSLVLGGAAGRPLKAIAFGAKERGFERELLAADRPLRLAGYLRLDAWQGRLNPSFHVKDAAFDG